MAANKEYGIEDWRSGKSLNECNLHLLEEQKYYDVTFNVTNTGADRPYCIKVLKVLLMNRSAVFEKMFIGEMAEKKDKIDITDIDPAAFYQLIRFIYADTANLTGETVFCIMYAAKKYMVSGLVSLCEEFLQTHVQPENAIMLLEQSFLFEAEKLQKRCMQMIQRETAKVFESEAFLNASHRTLNRILESNSLKVREIKVVDACLAWGKERCKNKEGVSTASDIRAALGDLIYLIRFPTMTHFEFTHNVLPLDLLENKDTALLFTYFSSKDKPTNMPFSDQPRSK